MVHRQTSRRISHIATTSAHLNKEDLMGLPLAKMWAGLNWFEVETAWATPERLVVTPLRDDGNPSRQQSLERPEIIGQPQGHSRRPVVIAKESSRNNIAK